MSMRIAFTGPMRTGKSTCSDYLVKNYRFVKFSIAGPLKELAKEYFDMEQKDRALLQDVGMSWRNIRPSVWVDYLVKNVANIKAVNDDVGITVDDVRFLNEGDILRENGFYIVRLNRETTLSEENAARANHVSETEMDGIRPDYTIENTSSLENLYSILECIIEEIKAREGINTKV